MFEMIEAFIVGGIFLCFLLLIIGLAVNLHNDWKIVWTDVGQWRVTYKGSLTGSSEYALYEIYYSKNRNKYKLKCKGTDPKGHTTYVVAVNKLNQLIQELNSKK